MTRTPIPRGGIGVASPQGIPNLGIRGARSRLRRGTGDATGHGGGSASGELGIKVSRIHDHPLTFRRRVSHERKHVGRCTQRPDWCSQDTRASCP